MFLFHTLSVAISLPIVILVLLLVLMIKISYIMITASELITLGRLASISMVDLLEDEVVVQALQGGRGGNSRVYHSTVVEPHPSGS